VARAVLSEEPYDLAVLYLDDAVPPGVSAAPLRRPVPGSLDGLDWSAFGFPEGFPRGSRSYGRVGTVLADGFVRLETTSPDPLEERFSGGGLWSPDYRAVVGIVGTHFAAEPGDERDGDGEAVTLYRADRCFGGDGLSALTGWTAEQAGEIALSSWGLLLQDDPEYGEHWAPRARGVKGPAERGYRFRGRAAALTAIAGWLDRDDRTEPRALVVTGSPGAGKSAVLGRVVTSADPVTGPMLPADGVVRAATGSVACAVHAAGKSAREVAREIARATSARLPDEPAGLAGAIRDALDDYGIERFNVVIDALDEAAPRGQSWLIIQKIVLPLVQQCERAQVVVGTRHRDDSPASHGSASSLVEAFGSAATVIDLDDEQAYFRLEDLEAYTLATLQQEGDGNAALPYADERVARPLARRIAELSGKNFLVAYLTAKAHGLRDKEPADFRKLTFPLDVENALRDYLGRIEDLALPSGGSVSATQLLTALAYAQAPGLPAELWIAAIEGLFDGARVPDGALRDFARSSAANFLIESGQESGSAFRLYHQALSDALLENRAGTTRQDQEKLARAFIDHGRQHGWGRAPRYLLRSLVSHAHAAGMLDELLADDGYLLHADLRRLLPESALAETPAGKRRSQLLQLTPYAVGAPAQERRALFSVTESLEKLGSGFRDDPGPAPYRARWATTTARAQRVRQIGHSGSVTDVCAFPLDGLTRLASGGEDGMVRIWDPANGQQLRVLEGHSGAVLGVCSFTSAGRMLLASAGTDHQVAVWDPASGDRKRVLDDHDGPVMAVCGFTAADGRTLLASAGADATLIVWDPVTGRRERTLNGHEGAVNAVCAFISGGRQLLASGGNDGVVAVWDPADGRRLRTLTGHEAAVNQVCAFTCGDRGLLASAGSDTLVKVWDPATGERERDLMGHAEGTVWSVCAFTGGDGRPLLASGGDDEAIRLWDPDTGQQRSAITGLTGGAYCVSAFTGAGHRPLLAHGGVSSSVQVWDPATGQLQRALGGGVADSVWSVCGFTGGDGRPLLASAGDNTVVRIWDPDTGREHGGLSGHSGSVWSVAAFAGADGRTLLATAGQESVVRVWDPVARQQRDVIDWQAGALWSVCGFTAADGRVLLAAAGQDSTVRIWDLAAGQCQRELTGHSGTVWWLCPFADDDGRALLASAADDDVVRVWDPVTGQLLQALAGHTGGTWSVCSFRSAYGQVQLATACADTMVRIWDPVTGELIQILKGHAAGVWSVCSFTADGRTLLASCGDDAMLRVWEPGTPHALQAIPVHAVPHLVTEVAGQLVLGLPTGLLSIRLDLDDW
jgi:WD40 repeat protein